MYKVRLFGFKTTELLAKGPVNRRGTRAANILTEIDLKTESTPHIDPPFITGHYSISNYEVVLTFFALIILEF